MCPSISLSFLWHYLPISAWFYKRVEISKMISYKFQEWKYWCRWDWHQCVSPPESSYFLCWPTAANWCIDMHIAAYQLQRCYCLPDLLSPPVKKQGIWGIWRCSGKLVVLLGLEDVRKAWWGSSKRITWTTEDTAGITEIKTTGELPYRPQIHGKPSLTVELALYIAMENVKLWDKR